MQSSTAGSRPIDRALHAYGASDYRAALKHALPVLERELPPLALALVVRAALEIKPDDDLRQALEGSVRVAIEAGNLPIALVAASWLRSVGSDGSRAYDAIAEAYGSGSSRLSEHLEQPTDLAQAPLDVHPLPDTTTDNELLARTRSAAQAASAAWSGRSPAELPHAPLFSAIEPAILRELLPVFEARVVGDGQRVIGEGELGSEAFMVARGELDVDRKTADGVHRVHVRRLNAGTLVGELGLLDRALRTASVTTVHPCVLLVVRKADVDRVAASFPGVARQVRKYCRRRILETLAKASPLFRNVTVNERMALVERFKIRTFASGERILSQGKPVDGLYLMAAGNAAVVRQKNMERRIVSQLGPGALIGEIELLLRRPVDEEVVAQHPTITLHLPREALLELGRAHPRLFVDLYERACRRDEDATTRDPPLWPNDPDLILV